ncbi:MAG: hypothetical protein K0B52_04455 [FCB group bacterium]|nr:hypothetical protein [FCB group bacterium]
MNHKPDTSSQLTWKVQLARRNLARSLSVAVLIVICVYFVLFTTQDILLTLAAFLILGIMVIPYYLPVTYTLTYSGITRKMLFSVQKRNWDEFHRYKTDKNSIMLYTMARPSRLDNYRSFLLICNKNKEDVLNIVKQKIHTPEDIPSS